MAAQAPAGATAKSSSTHQGARAVGQDRLGRMDLRRPGVQYDTTINEWHTCPEDGRINATNPCVTGDTLVATADGWQRIDELLDRQVRAGHRLRRAAAPRHQDLSRPARKPVYLLDDASPAIECESPATIAS